MTLFKQVALVVSLVFLLIVVTTTVGDFRRSSSFFAGQMQSTAQDMTTTLGIAMSNSTSLTDITAYETLFNAVFDSGYYSSIELTSLMERSFLKRRVCWKLKAYLNGLYLCYLYCRQQGRHR